MKKVIVITGPTGVGKTDYSIKLAKQFNGEIINADASQVYRRLNIGTAKITPGEMQGVKHHLIDFLDINQSFSIKEYQELGRKKIEEVDIPFIVGGSGLYIQALITDYKLETNPRTMDEPDISNEELYAKLLELDPEAAIKIHPNNRRRVLRYLQIAQEKGSVKTPPPVLLYDALCICLVRKREILYKRINHRCDLMIEQGWIDECISLRTDGLDLSKIKDIGYNDIGDYLDGKQSLSDTIEIIKQKQRRYAKRQLTWFRNKMNCVFIDLDETNYNDIKSLIQQFLD